MYIHIKEYIYIYICIHFYIHNMCLYIYIYVCAYLDAHSNYNTANCICSEAEASYRNCGLVCGSSVSWWPM